MADAALFVGFGPAARAREPQAVELLKNILGFLTALRDREAIEGVEPVLLDPHGGDLAGFLLIRGSREQLHDLRGDAEFRRMSIRAGLVSDGFGVVDAHAGDGFDAELALYEQQVNEQLSA